MNTLPLRALFLLAAGSTFAWAADQVPTSAQVETVTLDPVVQNFSFMRTPQKEIYFDISHLEDISVYEALKREGWTIYQPNSFLVYPNSKGIISFAGNYSVKGQYGYRSQFFLKYIEDCNSGAFFCVTDLSTGKVIALIRFAKDCPQATKLETLRKVLKKCILTNYDLNILMSDKATYAIYNQSFPQDKMIEQLKTFADQCKGIATLKIGIGTVEYTEQELKNWDGMNSRNPYRYLTPSEAHAISEKIRAAIPELEVSIKEIKDQNGHPFVFPSF